MDFFAHLTLTNAFESEHASSTPNNANKTPNQPTQIGCIIA